MKKMYVNLKRFDTLKEDGGVNSLAPMKEWAKYIIDNTREITEKLKDEIEVTLFFPEAHILNASEANQGEFVVGCQSVHEKDTSINGDIGMFTTFRTAKAMKQLGANAALIAHSEERKYYKEILGSAGVKDFDVVNMIMNQKIKCAIDAGMEVLYCIGETTEEQDEYKEVLKKQLEQGLKDVDLSKVSIGYEPVWAIGVGKKPADKEYITKIATHVKSLYPELPIVYGGGLKRENAKMVASIPELAGGLIALTDFTGEVGFFPETFNVFIQEYLEGENNY